MPAYIIISIILYDIIAIKVIYFTLQFITKVNI